MQISWDLNSRIQRSAFMSSKKSEQKFFDPYKRNKKTRKKSFKNKVRIARFVAGTPRKKSEHWPKHVKPDKTMISRADLF